MESLETRRKIYDIYEIAIKLHNDYYNAKRFEDFKNEKWSYKVRYIARALNNLEYDIYFNNSKNVFEGACLYD